MGIGPDEREILESLDLPEGFRVCELGSIIFHRGYRKKPGWWWRPAETLYKDLGCGFYASLDANGKGTYLADLNRPLWDQGGGLRQLFQSFDLVTDWGTSEHIFDVAQAWHSIHDLCKPGGLIVFAKPMDGYRNHGFYSFQPTFFKDLARANGYTVRLLMETETPRGKLIHGVFQKANGDLKKLRTPNQGKYLGDMKAGETGKGPVKKRLRNIRKGKP